MSVLIGATCGPRLRDEYRRALEAQGARVLEIASGTPQAQAALRDAKAVLGGMGGLLLSGGGDIAPVLYGERPICSGVDADDGRDAVELALARASVELGLPLLGICRGVQTLNVAMGGTLWQDLPAQCHSVVEHMDPAEPRSRQHLHHTVEVRAETSAATVLGAGTLGVNSFHHQAVRRVAPGLRVVATAPDGVVEALEAPGQRFILAVQWHPEDLWESHRRQADLFAAFCSAARAARPAWQ